MKNRNKLSGQHKMQNHCRFNALFRNLILYSTTVQELQLITPCKRGRWEHSERFGKWGNEIPPKQLLCSWAITPFPLPPGHAKDAQPSFPPLSMSLPSSLLQHICLPCSILHSHCFSPACFVQGTKLQFSSLHRWLQHPLNTRDQRSLTPLDTHPPEPRARLISQTFILLHRLKHLNSAVQLEVKMCLRESSRL